MISFSKRGDIRHPSSHLRCEWCGSNDTMPRGSSGTHYCRRCARLFRDAPEVPFDVVADQWTPALSALQAAGEIIAVHLPGGFYGICVLAGVIECCSAAAGGIGHLHD
jgi:ribosomal protein L37AE/L43A